MKNLISKRDFRFQLWLTDGYFKDQRELDALPAEIESLEARHAQLLEIIAQPGFYEQSPNVVATTLDAVTESEKALDRALERLVELEG